MKLIPLRTVPLVSDLPPAEITALLGGSVGNGPTAPFLGSVGTDAFVISRIKEYRSTNLPVLRGRLDPAPGGGTRVALHARPPGVVAVFMTIWLGFLAAVAALVVGAHAQDSSRSLLLLAAPAGVAGLSWLLMCAVFDTDARWAIERFLAMLPALRPDTGLPPGPGARGGQI